MGKVIYSQFASSARIEEQKRIDNCVNAILETHRREGGKRTLAEIADEIEDKLIIHRSGYQKAATEKAQKEVKKLEEELGFHDRTDQERPIEQLYNKIQSLGATIFVFRQYRFRKWVSRKDTARFLSNNGMRQLTRQEALIHISQTPELKLELSIGESWFDVTERCKTYTFDSGGRFREMSYSETIKQTGNISQETLLVEDGRWYADLHVLPDDLLRRYPSFPRFQYNVDKEPSWSKAPVIVAVKASEPEMVDEQERKTVEGMRIANAQPISKSKDEVKHAEDIQPQNKKKGFLESITGFFR